jgi:hypothetical protein
VKRKSILLLTALTPALLPGSFAFSAGAALQAVQAIETKSVAQQCLACHGPYDKIAAATKDFKASSGETVTPHQYVPHAGKKDVPDCTECHTAHPLPLKDKSTVVKPTNADWCYATCHHAYNLQPCKNCH